MNCSPGGAVAQLGARLDGIEEVEGSNPFGSTRFSTQNGSQLLTAWNGECRLTIGRRIGAM
jgi:hypothetical protein